MLLTIRHRTTYNYANPVTLQPHRLLLCPRGNYDLTLVARQIECMPAASIDWSQDTFGNLIASATFAETSDRLTIDSHMVVEQCAQAWPVFTIAPSAHLHPFTYSPDEMLDLGALLVPGPQDAGGRLPAWVQSFVSDSPTDTLSLLQAINSRINGDVAYRSRDEEGTQSASETLAIASGSCRDMATLFIEAARLLGFGARAVSGYLYDPTGDEHQHGSTHAWAEVYLPCAGWIAFDPTNARMGSANLVPVAVARTIGQIMPITGGFIGGPDDFVDMAVEVHVTGQPVQPDPQGS
ncbi:transglutaminase family protein [Sphingomonas crusticola]|uniref:transglutaminase family protein n=1 Tax=Sphingomonas crusticola TaxID=1697973 RepID=UPI000E23A511|nr:transglutaminase family protein [Sphingomonas crusticola]